MIFCKDSFGNTAFMDFIEKASFDVIINVFSAYGFEDPENPDK